MAWQTLRDAGPLRLAEAGKMPSAMQVMAAAITMNLLSPMLPIFFLAFLPQFIDATDGRAVADMIRLSLVIMAMTFAVFVVYGLLAARFRTHILSRPVVFTATRRRFGAGFAALGLMHALTRP